MTQSEKQRLKCIAAGSKAARSCDSCKRTARWYCAADDAFLCQRCDASVHSANSVSHRHHHLQLRTPSPEAPLPAWLSGFTRKARTPRSHNKAVSPVVPELETSEENTEEKDEKQYLVPIADYCSSASSPDDNYNTDVKPLLTTVQFPHDVNSNSNSNSNSNNSSDCLVGLLPSEMDFAEFAADMESLLLGGLDNGSFSMEELGLGDTNCGRQLIKEELDSQNTDGDIELYEEMDLSRETTLDINFDDRGSQTSEDDQEETKAAMTGLRPATQCQSRKKVGLRLDYEALITEWSVQGSCSPWMNGKRPQFGPDDCWLDCMGMWGGDQVQGLIDEGREARVSRYREKRRTRLFSKKIRYEVRKLNAEKRPRMKGRFVKRASFAGATATAGTAFPY